MADQKPLIQIDDDWKRQAQEEKRKLAEQEQKAKETRPIGAAPVAGAVAGTPTSRPGPRDRREIPPASFGSIVQTLMTQALFYLGDLAPSLPDYAIEAIREALPAFGKQIRGFDRADAVLTGIETRTSSPVRITRDNESLQSLNLKGLYPAGEGAGYAGGILSAGVDGIKVAEAVAKSILAGH